MVYYIGMKNVFKILFLTSIVFASAGCKKEGDSMPEYQGPVDVIVISGQSNAVGCTRSSEIKMSVGASAYSDYLKGFEDVKIAYDNWDKITGTDAGGNTGTVFKLQHDSKKEFVKVMLGQGNGDVTFGPEIGIANTLHEKHANKLYIIKCACGASNLKDDWVKRDSPMYGRFVEYVKNQMNVLKSKGLEPTIKALCWMQGEGDAYDGYYQDYYDNTKEFVGNLREDFKELAGNKDFPFIDAGISDAVVPGNGLRWPKYDKVNEAKKKFANESENNYFIDTIEAGMHTNEEPRGNIDYAHYDSESELLLGKLFAEQFEQFLMKD